ncbi:MAG: glutamine--fructose-6-phosphate transaminase (isomerizing) [Legionellales bacterium]|nr:glutamine--fructose-6-phosphate transaminase (isomerizing) [Legionellales bacterium]
MCGIVGAVAERNVIPILIEGLKRLEYRGYDSAGVATLNEEDDIQRLRVVGKVNNLVQALNDTPLKSSIGISHTRWATHGAPNENNAHPHQSENKVAIVHNGIIENHEAIKQFLLDKGYVFHSETDTEVAAHFVHYYLSQGLSIKEILAKATKEFEGAYALLVMLKQQPNKLYGLCRGCPLVIGKGLGENYFASDSLALLPVTQQIIYLENGDIAEIDRKQIIITDSQLNNVERSVNTLDLDKNQVNKGKYRHFMQKEIFDQAEAITATLEGRISDNHILTAAFGNNAEQIFSQVKQVQIIACGTSYHAGMVAKYWLEKIAGIQCHVEVASEFRYREKVIFPGTLFIAISQSGETADTLAALRQAKELNCLATLAICNVPESAIVRESDLVFMTRAGVEIGVASTKAFTTQLIALLLLTIALAKRTKNGLAEEGTLVQHLNKLPKKINQVLELDHAITGLAKLFTEKHHALFLGRGTSYPVALEGALKLKEISYIHAEAYPAGELKHGPLALVDKDMPVISIAPQGKILEKLKSNLHEVRARAGQLIIFADENAKIKSEDGIICFDMPEIDEVLAPILYTIPLQLLAYHVAVIKGTDVDQPRNLAKSVTVE